ncbi:hypothetical protein MMC08_008960 [Hypocenomyce scalaris]|nr:hypothetical protein [Hypocenomyce scalaris]
MNLDTERLLGVQDEKRPSPLRVRIPPNPHAFSAGDTPSKSDAHISNASLRERLHNKCILSATTVLLLLVVSVLYSKTGARSSEQFSAPGRAELAHLRYDSTPASGQFSSAEAGNSALNTPEAFSGRQQAPEASIGEKASPEVDVAAQLTTALSTQQESTTKAVVVAQHREDIAWLQELPSNIRQYVYQADNATAERPLRVNQGETAVYLQYIVEHYHNLPGAVVFMHAHQTAPHMPDKLDLLTKLKWDAFGYANLRYTNVTYDLWGKWTGDWLCPQNPLEPPPSDEIIWDELRVNQSKLFAEVWEELFVGPIGPMPQYVHSPCCAEFVVAKERIHARPLSFYEDSLLWLEATSSDRYWAGRIFEYVWHIIFGEPALYHAPDKCELLYC